MSVVALQISYSVGSDTGEQSLVSFAAAFERAGDNLKDFGQYVFPRVIDVLQAAEKDQFEASGKGPMIGNWKALSTNYAKWKEANYPGKPLLELTGKLKGALTRRNSAYAVRDYSASMMNFGTVNVPWASYHQTGTPFMPARAPFDFGPEFEAEIFKAARLGALAAIRAAKVEVEVQE